jgi:hypothetical protein
LAGETSSVLRAARRLLIFVSMVTLALNVAVSIFTGRYGEAGFDAVGPLLLIGWAEVGVRHEALFDRVEVEGLHPLTVVAGSVKLRAV